MHYSNLVIVPKNGSEDIAEKVAEAMGPSEESGNGFWDWYQIGGRWTGLFDGYEPEKDPKNTETCAQCGGSGRRDDELGKAARERDPSYTCNGCGGKGERPTWPTQWGIHDGDIIPLDSVTEEQFKKFYRVVIEGREFGGSDYRPWRPVGETIFPKREGPPLDWLKATYPDHLAVIVDNHG